MKGRLKRWGIALLIGAVVIVPTLILVVRWMGSSSDGNIHVGTPATTTKQPTEPVAITTPYFTTTLPAGFNVKRQTETPAAAQTLLQMVADGGADNQQQVAATVGVTPSEGLSGVGDYNLRVATPTSYARFSPTSLPAGATAFRNTSGPAGFVVFWPHGTHYVELALTSDGGATSDQLQALYTHVMANWAWK